jgi:hypothetical protein
VPCNHSWNNHGEYVSRVAHVAEAFRSAGVISEDKKHATISAAARSNCGRK